MITENVPADYESGIWHEYGQDIAYYTGSTTGTSRDNEICSQYSAITWQVDRKCHLISASSFGKLCADMKTQVDDMSDDLYAHGSRELVADELASTQLTREQITKTMRVQASGVACGQAPRRHSARS